MRTHSSSAHYTQQAWAWASITAIMAGVDTVQVAWDSNLPKKVIDRLIEMGGQYVPRRYGNRRRIIRVHNLSRDKLVELERTALTYELSVTRVDVRFDFSFAVFIKLWMWQRNLEDSWWIPYSRNVKRRYWWTDDYKAYVARCKRSGRHVEHDAEYNGNVSLKDFSGKSKPTRNLTVYRDPDTLSGLPYPTPTTRLEVSIGGSTATVRRFFKDGIAAIMEGDPEVILRRFVCLRIGGVNMPIPPLPVPIEWEVDGGGATVKAQQTELHISFNRLVNPQHTSISMRNRT